MRINISTALIFCFLTISACTSAPEKNDFDATLKKSGMLQRIKSASIILLGEKHDNEAHHQVQATVLENALTAQDVVVFEMLTRDQQPVIDQYLADEISFSDLPIVLKWAKSGWPQWAYYAPLFKIAKDKGAIISYGSYPRSELKSKMTGDPDQASPLPDYLKSGLNAEIRESHCDLLPEAMIKPMSNIQIAKDKLMASQLLKNTLQGRAYLIAGNGHVRKDRGVPFYLSLDAPAKVTFVLGVLEDRNNFSNLEPFNQFDSVWTTISNPEKDYCAGLRKKFGK